MTDEQIIKGLECCADDSVIRCEECPYGVNIFTCNQMQMRKDALDLINRQKAEIERLQRLGASAARKAVDERKKLLDAKAEIERLKNKFEISSAYSFGYFECQIDSLVKEMEGDAE